MPPVTGHLPRSPVTGHRSPARSPATVTGHRTPITSHRSPTKDVYTLNLADLKTKKQSQERREKLMVLSQWVSRLPAIEAIEIDRTTSPKITHKILRMVLASSACFLHGCDWNPCHNLRRILCPSKLRSPSGRLVLFCEDLEARTCTANISIIHPHTQTDTPAQSRQMDAMAMTLWCFNKRYPCVQSQVPG